MRSLAVKVLDEIGKSNSAVDYILDYEYITVGKIGADEIEMNINRARAGGAASVGGDLQPKCTLLPEL